MSMTTRFGISLALVLACATLSSAGEVSRPPNEPSAIAAGIHRSPVDLVLSSAGDWLATANQSSHSVSLARTRDGKVLDEIDVGERPAALALAPDGKRLLVTASHAGMLTVLEVVGERLEKRGALKVGHEPTGVAIASDGALAYVARASAGDVAIIDLAANKVVGAIPAGRWPRYLALTPDDKRLAVGLHGDGGVTVLDTVTRKRLFVEAFVGLNFGHMHIDAAGQHVYFPWTVYRANPISPSNIRLGWVLASRLGKVRLDRKIRRDALSLDPPGKAVADTHGLALTRDEKTIIMSASGSHELLVFQREGLPFIDFGETDHIDSTLEKDSNRFFRIPAGQRPMGLRIARDDRTVYVADQLGDAVLVVDLERRAVTKTIKLGGPARPDLVRQGEIIFHDARRSLDQWYSCHSCHYNGGGNAGKMDTRNDGTVFTFKTVLPLQQVELTGPWTWHGWQKDLQSAMVKSLTDTMLGPTPTADDAKAVAAYLGSLRLPPNPHRADDGSLTPAAERGKALFHSERAGCADCHAGPRFTDGQIHDVGTGANTDYYKGYNTPSLLGVYRKTHLLHDGRSRDLTELLAGPHDPAKLLGVAPLTPQERADLVDYLKAL